MSQRTGSSNALSDGDSISTDAATILSGQSSARDYRHVFDYLTSCDDDPILFDTKRIESIFRNDDERSTGLKTEERDFIREQNQDAVRTDATRTLHDLIYSVLKKSAKNCVNEKLTFDVSGKHVMNWLTDFPDERSRISDRLRKHCFVRLLQCLDKFLSDNIDEWSDGNNNLKIKTEVSKYLWSNRFTLRKWLQDSRMSSLHLTCFLNDVASCSVIINRLICSSLKITNSYDKHQDFAYHCESIEPLTKNQWEQLVMFTISCAKYSNDLNILRGVESFIQAKNISCSLPLDLITCNIEGKYLTTYKKYLSRTNHTVWEDVEFFAACYRLNRLENHIPRLASAQSSKIGKLYRFYLSAKSDEVKDRPKEIDELHSWLRSWSDPIDECQISPYDKFVTMKEYSDVISNIHLIHLANEGDIIKRHQMIEFLKLFMDQERYVRSMFQIEDTATDWSRNYVILHALINEKSCDELNLQILRDPRLCFELSQAFRRLNSNHNHVTQNESHFAGINMELLIKSQKFALKNDMNEVAQEISLDINSSVSSLAQLHSQLLLLKYNLNFASREKNQNYIELTKVLCYDQSISEAEKHHMILEILCEVLKSLDMDQDTMKSVNIMDLDGSLVNLATKFDLVLPTDREQNPEFETVARDLQCKVRILAGRLYDNLAIDDVSKFIHDWKLLVLLDGASKAKYASYAIETALAILDAIKTNKLPSTLIMTLNIDNCFRKTVNIWLKLRANVLTLLICSQRNMTSQWITVLSGWVKLMIDLRPELFIYQALVNRLDLCSKIAYLNDRPTEELRESPAIFLQYVNLDNDAGLSLDDYRSELKIWDTVHRNIVDVERDPSSICWATIARQTELFIHEIRRLSCLPGEYLKSSLARLHRNVNQVTELLRNDQSNMDEVSLSQLVYNQLEGAYRGEEATIRVLLNYCDWVERYPADTSIYDTWFLKEPGVHLRSLDNILRPSICARDRVPFTKEIIFDIEQKIRECCAFIMEFVRRLNDKLYMALVSPRLSKFHAVGDSALMPLHYQSSHDHKLVFISKIQQQVLLIRSLTNPKKISFTGSDGAMRSFCLKAHEDSRLNQTFMNIFDLLNVHLKSNKQTRDLCQLRHYSIMPVGTSAGLIEWLNSPTLLSIFNQWLRSPNGRRFCEKFYSDTCQILCDSNKDDHRCQAPSSQHLTPAQLFYQLLWSKIKQSGDEKLIEQRPGPQDMAMYRQGLDKSVFEQITLELINILPQDLLAQRLWYKSENSYECWKKTRLFTGSCAASSFVGYILGLGDRHPDNILLNDSTGELIHIDTNMCFGLGEKLKVPELVPFRLTQSIQTTFGFAGLQGPFTILMTAVGELLRRRKSTVLKTLSPELLGLFALSKRSMKFLAVEGNKHLAEAACFLDQRLSGRDGSLASVACTPDSAALNPGEVVSILIERASSIERMSMMFEGWLPWV